jgi:hypothetical protein
VGALHTVTQLTTAIVAITAVLLRLGKRWAIAVNVVIGVWSVVLIQIAGGPFVNQEIVVFACAVTTALSLAVARRRSGLTASHVGHGV